MAECCGQDMEECEACGGVKCRICGNGTCECVEEEETVDAILPGNEDEEY